MCWLACRCALLAALFLLHVFLWPAWSQPGILSTGIAHRCSARTPRKSLQFICLAFYQKEMALYVRKNLDRCAAAGGGLWVGLQSTS